MITRDLVEPLVPSGRARIPGDDGWLRCAAMDRGEAEQFLRLHQFAIGGEWRVLREGEYQLVAVPTCQCCGAIATALWENGQARCPKHYERNPCAIEGCKRSRTEPESGRLADDAWLCSEHWRRFVPPRSLRRRAYHAFFRQAKRHGWDDDLRRQFWRFWNQLVATARAKAKTGTLDITEINRLFGWEQS